MIGAIDKDRDGNIHPTGAGLLMFGEEYRILRQYPEYFFRLQRNVGSYDSMDRQVIFFFWRLDWKCFDFILKSITNCT